MLSSPPLPAAGEGWGEGAKRSHLIYRMKPMRITRHLGHSCRILIGTSILLTLVVVNPRVGVRRKMPHRKKATPKSRTMSAGCPRDKESIAKLIVGAWNVGGDGKSKLIVFKPDGRYEDRGVNLFCEEQEVRNSTELLRIDQVFVASQGKWQVLVTIGWNS